MLLILNIDHVMLSLSIISIILILILLISPSYLGKYINNGLYLGVTIGYCGCTRERSSTSTIFNINKN